MPAPSWPSVRSRSLRRTDCSYWPRVSVMRLMESGQVADLVVARRDGDRLELAFGDGCRLPAEFLDRPHEPPRQHGGDHQHGQRGRRAGDERGVSGLPRPGPPLFLAVEHDCPVGPAGRAVRVTGMHVAR